MCTAATYITDDFYFGRTLDYEFSYVDEVTITPRNYIFNFRSAGTMRSHYAIIGIAYVLDNYPLYYDGVNEKGDYGLSSLSTFLFCSPLLIIAIRRFQTRFHCIFPNLAHNKGKFFKVADASLL